MSAFDHTSFTLASPAALAIFSLYDYAAVPPDAKVATLEALLAEHEAGAAPAEQWLANALQSMSELERSAGEWRQLPGPVADALDEIGATFPAVREKCATARAVVARVVESEAHERSAELDALVRRGVRQALDRTDRILAGMEELAERARILRSRFNEDSEIVGPAMDGPEDVDAYFARLATGPA